MVQSEIRAAITVGHMVEKRAIMIMHDFAKGIMDAPMPGVRAMVKGAG